MPQLVHSHQWQQHCTAQPGSSTGTLHLFCVAMAALSPAWEQLQPQSCFAPSRKPQSFQTGPSNAHRSSKLTTMPLLFLHRQQWLKPAMVAVVNLVTSHCRGPDVCMLQIHLRTNRFHQVHHILMLFQYVCWTQPVYDQTLSNLSCLYQNNAVALAHVHQLITPSLWTFFILIFFVSFFSLKNTENWEG